MNCLGGLTINFTAIDVETANPDLASICQIGIAQYRNGQLFDSWSSLVDPQDHFAGMNVSIHGIDEETVAGSPTFSELYTQIYGRLAGGVAISHTPFDRTAIASACTKQGFAPPNATWLDTAKIARRTWSQFSRRGYGLANLASEFGITFQHHDALEDARAAAEILLRATEETGNSLQDWQNFARRKPSEDNISTEGNVDGPLYGEVVVFTGSLSILRTEASRIAAQAGCRVTKSVTRATTLLVVGDQDIRQLAGHEKSTKHRKVEKLIADGLPLRILRESDFRSLVDLEG